MRNAEPAGRAPGAPNPLPTLPAREAPAPERTGTGTSPSALPSCEAPVFQDDDPAGPHDAGGAHVEAAGDGGPVLTGIGSRLREQRRRSGLTLEAAAARVGLSPAHLSRLETERRQPSLPVLLGLSRAYATSVADLLGEESGGHDPVVRAGAPEGRAGGWDYRRAGVPGLAMQPLRLHIPPGVQDAVVRVHPGEEWLYVLSGRLRLGLGAAVHLLDPGDAAHFDSMTPHRLVAGSAEGVDVLFVHTLLQSPVSGLCAGPPQRHP
jgi:transcriptional regulator with XRE-family HTH domain